MLNEIHNFFNKKIYVWYTNNCVPGYMVTFICLEMGIAFIKLKAI